MPRIRAASIEEHKAITRQDILEAAQELFARFGYQRTSLGDIAAEVGIGRTTLYEYFRDKEDLLATLVEETLPTVIDDMVAALPADAPADVRLRELARRMVEFVATDPTLGLLLHRDVPKLSLASQERVAAAHERLARTLAGILREGVEAGIFRPMAPDLAGRLTQDVIMSGARVLIDSSDPAARLTEIAGETADVLVRGLGA